MSNQEKPAFIAPASEPLKRSRAAVIVVGRTSLLATLSGDWSPEVGQEFLVWDARHPEKDALLARAGEPVTYNSTVETFHRQPCEFVEMLQPR